MPPRPHLTFLEKLSKATYSELFSLWFLLNVICSFVYFWFATIGNSSAPSQLSAMDSLDRLFNSFYFGFATATSVGYGDIVPHGFSKIIAMVQAALSLLIFALFVAKLVARRQDVTLDEVHRMTAEGIFYNLRQGLFLVRKDFDALIHHAEENGKFSEHEWDILTTAYLHAQNLIEEIPNLYNGHGHDLYIIDGKREKLLIEAIHRTLLRMESLFDLLDEKKIRWRKHAASTEELLSLLKIMENSMSLWRKKSPTPKMNVFDETMRLARRIRKQL